ncbi:uncharacterized protein LOC115619998 [Scaptodrosophila lebanonensis]|uniref:Glycosyltransferase family 92 protein n=1 Tax=Drosophila lebanonensis TaxID=7225 RepID=A0A6J2T212_DROLE|nr:uncharacterized protein LOC115619998 [Scaptodrosophila lebanonensis]
MRKYQQLALLLISCFSIGVLLMYKSENNRLKYVLKYVNFFGRSDAAILRRLEKNATKEDLTLPALSKPLPVFQLIGESFHAYSAFWKRNELVARGEAHILVVGKKGAVVDFRCTLIYDGGARSVQGKFRFQRDANESIAEDKSTTFTNYNFYCLVNRDFGKPEYVSLMDTTASLKTQMKLRLRYLKPSNKNTESNLLARLPATICVDLVTYNMSSNNNNLLQFFLYHQALGVEHFLVYNYDQLPEKVISVLERTSMHLYALPFNFPFVQANGTVTRIRQLILTDCLLRNSNYAALTMLLTPNEFFYPSVRIVGDQSQLSFYRQLRHYTTEISRFQMATFSVCIDTNRKLLIDNTHYDPELKPPHKMFFYRLDQQSSQLLALTQAQSVELPLSSAFVHRYVHCQHVGEDGLHDWRNGVREDFMEHINALRNEVDVLI